jgi:hypothetical protein
VGNVMYARYEKGNLMSPDSAHRTVVTRRKKRRTRIIAGMGSSVGPVVRVGMVCYLCGLAGRVSRSELRSVP